MAILEVKNIEKHFGSTQVLKDVSFSMEEGNALAIIGSSGSGKTTLLRCLNFLETPDSGSIAVKGEMLYDASKGASQNERELRKKRLHFGMVFQSFHLFPQYTALENVMLAEQLLAKERPDYKQNKKAILDEIHAHGEALLKKMGLEQRENHYPHQLSGGQQQRVFRHAHEPAPGDGQIRHREDRPPGEADHRHQPHGSGRDHQLFQLLPGRRSRRRYDPAALLLPLRPLRSAAIL